MAKKICGFQSRKIAAFLAGLICGVVVGGICGCEHADHLCGRQARRRRVNRADAVMVST